jgi:hypothetical protein
MLGVEEALLSSDSSAVEARTPGRHRGKRMKRKEFKKKSVSVVEVCPGVESQPF